MQVSKILLRLNGRPLDIGVLDAEHERGAGSTSQQPVEERRTSIAHMKLTGRTRSEANTHS